jgi:hypothetical protein
MSIIDQYRYEDDLRAERDRARDARRSAAAAVTAKLREIRAEVRDIAAGLSERAFELCSASSLATVGETLAGLNAAAEGLARACAEAEAELVEIERIRREAREA